eukprot:TRINITY_DN7839_c0_g2_i1.p1 TRINITY_DN7839_c0_g2~~TRINITY_DN7839_c0_g2_i1.p1  ORF type:complete len:338 (-),score=60.77 TRINITY_DN7839_c0_g2_i1:29-1042(-)
METVDVIALSHKASLKAAEDSVKVPFSYSEDEKESLLSSLKDKGYIRLKLKPEQTKLIKELSEQAESTLWSCAGSWKKQAMKEFRKSKILRNWFSYATLNGPGKETWKIRVLNSEEQIITPSLPGMEELLYKSYLVAHQLHQVLHSVLEVISEKFNEPQYLLDLIEPPLHCNDDFPFGLSQLILLNYFDPKKLVPVNPHTDQYLLTAIPINSSSPGLEMWDFEEQKWFCPELDSIEPWTEIIIVAGETLSKITSDYFVSGLHQVVGPQPIPGTRFSCPYFLSAAKGKMLHATGFSASADPFEPIEVGDFLWHCTQQPNDDENTSTQRKRNSDAMYNR